MNYNVLIIGSGLGGLECGTLLAKRGLKVLVLEGSNQPGGCMQSFRRGGMHYDTGLHYVGGLAPGQTMHHIGCMRSRTTFHLIQVVSMGTLTGTGCPEC